MGHNDSEDGRPVPPIPHNDAERLKVAQQILPQGGLGDGAPEDRMLQSMCKTICKLFNVPIAAVSIIQKDTLTMRASHGLPTQFTCSRKNAFCAWTLVPKFPETLVIEDLTRDSRFTEHPNVVAAPYFKFYAGAPLITTTQHVIGTVCLLDTSPRKMTAEQYNVLNNFAELAIRRLEDKHYPDFKNARLLRSPEDVSESVVLCDLSNSRWWSILYANAPFAQLAGVSEENMGENTFWKLFRPANNEAKNKVLEQLDLDIQAGKDFVLQARRREAGLEGSAAARDSTFDIHFRPATKQNLGAHAGKICVPNVVDAVELGDNSSISNYFFATVEKSADSGSAQAVKSTRLPRQQTFYSKEYAMNFPVTSKQPVSEGMRDVTMGVLCSQNGHALVYRGRWRKKAVSVKVIEAKQADCIRSAAFGAAFVPKEAALSLDLDHPNVMITHKLVTENLPDKMCKAMLVREWAGLGTVGDAIQRGWLLMPDKSPNHKVIMALAQEIAQGMAYLHEEGILNASLDCDSISLSEEKGAGQTEFSPKLADLSNAFLADEPPSSVKVTTPTQTSPEHFSKGQVTQASDVYAFGMLWWELFNGQRVWPSMGPEAIKKKVLNKEIPSMPDEFGKGVENLMLDCLSFKPSNRPSFAEVVKRIAIMQQELRTGRPMTGVATKGGDDGGLMKGRLFRDRPKENKATNGNSAPSPHILEKASQDTADQQKKSVFKRFADKFKV